MIRKIAIFLLLIALICWMTVPAQAIALEFVITGATVMTMALMGTIGLMAINGAGFSDALVTAAENAGRNAKSFAQDLFASYARSQNITAGQAVQLGQQGIKYTEDGLILMNESVSNLYSGFVKWAFDGDGGPNLKNYAQSVQQGNVIENGNLEGWTNPGIVFPFQFLTGVSGQYNAYYGGNKYIAAFETTVNVRYCLCNNFYGGNCWITLSSKSPFSARTSVDISTDGSLGASAIQSTPYTIGNNTVYYIRLGWYGSFREDGVQSGMPSSTRNGPIAYLMQYGSVTEGGVEYPGVDTNIFDGIDVENGQDINILDPSDIVTAPDTNVTGGVIDVQAWLDMLADVIAEGQAEIALEVDGALEDVTVTAAESDIAVEAAGSESIPGAGEIADSTSVDGLDQYTLELTDFFPFCIPFDIYDMLSLFAAQREAPSFEWRFYVPNVVDETIEIDLSPFDPVAQVLRTVELIAAAIGLAFVTKKLIQGGD